MTKNSLHYSLFRNKKDNASPGEDIGFNTPLLETPRKSNNAVASSLPTPPLSPSPSAPSIVFPTKTDPPSPQPSSRRRAFTMHMGCSADTDDEDAASEPTHFIGCRALDRLRKIKRTVSAVSRPRSESPCLGSHHPTVSSRASSPVYVSRPPSSAEVGETTRSHSIAPVLTLPNEDALNTGFGWEDEFGMLTSTKPIPSRPWSTTFSQSSKQTLWSQPSRPPSRQSAMEYPTMSTGFLSSNSISLAMPSPAAVLEAAEWCRFDPTPHGDDFSMFRDKNSRESEGVPFVRFREEPEVPSPPPRLGFQLHRSSEDWASAVLKAVGSDVENFED
ncbi:hypothetical protein K439DRAFT_1005876 [Ramaria rubella]|nr:hypothetical protein K439DRAFT_1005876 [Ramaria rubella]